jgi:hypothetical protein
VSASATLGQLFDDEPHSWGLRGDPYLWKAMRESFSSVPLPSDAAELEQQLARAFQELTGRPLSTATHFFVEEFAHGGMSSGGISPEFWRERALPLLRARHAEARR